MQVLACWLFVQALQLVHQRHHAAVLVEPRVEHEAAEGAVGVPRRRGDPLDDRLEDLVDPHAHLGRGGDRPRGVDPDDVLDLLPGVAPQVFMSVPAYWEKIARAIQAGRDTSDAVRRVTGGRLRFCLSGGAGLKVEIKELLHQHGVTRDSLLTMAREMGFKVEERLFDVDTDPAEDHDLAATRPTEVAPGSGELSEVWWEP